MDGPSPARLYATAVGAALVVAGIVGFFYSASFGSPGEVDEVFGVFAVNGWDNVLHILTGVLGLIVAGLRLAPLLALARRLLRRASPSGGSRSAAASRSSASCPVNTGDNLLHLVLGALGVLAALGTPATRKKTTKKAAPATA